MKNRYFELAESVSNLSDYPRIHIGSVIVKNKEVVSVGQNMMKTHPAQHRYNQYVPHPFNQDYLHSEINAIRKGKTENLKGSTLYIFRRDRNGNTAMCRPCNACMQAIKDAGIKEIYYSIPNGFSFERIS